jgi:hypothetical protein
MGNITSPAEVVRSIGPCSMDVEDCEITRTTVVLEDASPDNLVAQDIRRELAKVVCVDCSQKYLCDIAGYSTQQSSQVTQKDLPLAPEVPWGPKLKGHLWREKDGDTKPFVGWQ